MNSKKISHFLIVLLPLLVVLLTMRSECTVIHHVAEEGMEEWMEFCSGFNTVALHSGNYAPLITGVLSAVLMISGLAYLSNGSQRLCRAMMIISLIGVATSLIPCIFGSMTSVGWRIFAVLDAEAAIVCELLLLI